MYALAVSPPMSNGSTARLRGALAAVERPFTNHVPATSAITTAAPSAARIAPAPAKVRVAPDGTAVGARMASKAASATDADAGRSPGSFARQAATDSATDDGVFGTTAGMAGGSSVIWAVIMACGVTCRANGWRPVSASNATRPHA